MTAHQRPLPGLAEVRAAADTYTALKTDNARLRRDQRDLAQQLDLALAAIQRLSIDNDRLRTASAASAEEPAAT
ncbi:hypothetical protein ACH4Y0_34365 [Streptomyces sp. NPDC020707]|uniref:hypothetical protein n=1 Tax=Streptomyces sp. NPDC020707 TaxID=3365084 RepID=UPI0037B595A9